MPTVWRPIPPWPDAWLIETSGPAYAVRANGWGGWAFTPLPDDAFDRIEAAEPEPDEQDEADAVLALFHARTKEIPC